jgi:hypothetical protein
VIDLGELEEPEDLEPECPGWEAIEGALLHLYGDVQPRQFGTILRHALGGHDPVDGISVYPCTGPRAHWHYVTYGFTELYVKESNDPEVSGWGFELTFRLARGDEVDPPTWPLNVLQGLGRRVFDEGDCFESGDVVDLGAPLGGQVTRLVGLAFTRDPLLPPLDTVHGSVEFLLLVGLTEGDLAALVGEETETFLERLAESQPLLVTDVAR